MSTSILSGESRSWADHLSQPDHEVAIRIDVRVPMRDGVELSADVYLPAKEGKWPVILERTPYDNSGNFYVNRARYFARRGYAYVVQDFRGRNDSDGKWYAWYSEIDDGRDTLDWCGTQPWSDGNVGMNGMSYMGLVQWMAAPTGSPYLRTIIPQMAPADYDLFGMNYTGGAFQLHINEDLPRRTVPVPCPAAGHPLREPGMICRTGGASIAEPPDRGRPAEARFSCTNQTAGAELASASTS